METYCWRYPFGAISYVIFFLGGQEDDRLEGMAGGATEESRTLRHEGTAVCCSFALKPSFNICVHCAFKPAALCLSTSIWGTNRHGFPMQDYLERSLEEVNRDLAGLTKRSYDIGRVYITFETEQAQRKCLKAVEIGGLCVCL